MFQSSDPRQRWGTGSRVGREVESRNGHLGLLAHGKANKASRTARAMLLGQAAAMVVGRLLPSAGLLAASMH